MKKSVCQYIHFRRPNDLATLNDGRFVVRTDGAVCIFDKDGNLVKLIGEKNFSRCLGLASDGVVRKSISFLLQQSLKLFSIVE